MNPKYCTFEASVIIPAAPPEMGDAYLDAVEIDGKFELQWRAFHEWPQVVQSSTGKRGRIVRSLISDVRELPPFGKVTLTFENFLVLDWPGFREWETDDWHPVS